MSLTAKVVEGAYDLTDEEFYHLDEKESSVWYDGFIVVRGSEGQLLRVISLPEKFLSTVASVINSESQPT
jgi:hypothetical protein